MITGYDIIAQALSILGVPGTLGQRFRYTCCTALRDLLDRWYNEGLVGPIPAQLEYAEPLWVDGAVASALAYNLATILRRFWGHAPNAVADAIAVSFKDQLVTRAANMPVPTEFLQYGPSFVQRAQQMQALINRELSMQVEASAVNKAAYDAAVERLARCTGYWRMPYPTYSCTREQQELIQLLLEARAEYQAQLDQIREAA